MNASCDTLNHLIVKTAHVAFEKEDITPLLKWVKKEKEKEFKDLFNKTLIVRNQGKEAQDIANSIFWKHLSGCTLPVRVRHIQAKHRQELLNLQSLKQIKL